MDGGGHAHEWTKLVIGMVAAMLVAAISTSTMTNKPGLDK
jgi:hypothetical protein